MPLFPEDIKRISTFLRELANFDDELFENCWPLLEAGKYDDAVRKAFLVLEERLRDIADVKGATGRELAQKAFGSGDGPVAKKMRVDQATGNALRELYSGAFGVFRNPTAHHLDVDYNASECQEVITFVNLLLRKLGEAQSAYERVLDATRQLIKAKMPSEYKLRRVSSSKILQVHLQDVKSHYELRFMKRDRFIEVALHFEENWEFNQHMLELFRKHESALREKLGNNSYVEKWGARWGRVYQKLPWEDPEKASADKLADTLVSFIQATHPVAILGKNFQTKKETRAQELRGENSGLAPEP
jgi:uncharacterized protein (TIGR02391 family)